MDTLPPGSKIGPYLVDCVIGEGGFGRVYQAVSPKGGTVALKVSSERPADMRALQLSMHENEIEALGQIRHPRVVGVLDHGFLPTGELYIAMERATGRMLDEVLAQRGRIDALQAIRYITALCDALAHCHERGILHLDLKPENIVVVDEHQGDIKVLDFGLARLSRSWSGEIRGVSGTPPFMAPESFEGKPADARVDLYAVGALLYTLLAGVSPFPQDTVPAVYAAKRTGEVVRLEEVAPGVPAALCTLVGELMDPDPDTRPQNASNVRHDLKAIEYAILAGHDHGEVPDARGRRWQAKASEAPMVGRDAELRMLRTWLAELPEIGARVMVSGEVGVGKSRLVAEFLAGLPAGEALIGYGRCRESGGLLPHAILREAMGQLAEQLGRLPSAGVTALEDAVAKEDPAELAHVGRLVPDIGRLPALTPPLGDMPVPPSVGRCIAAAVRAIAAARPVILVLEDVHWADEGATDALRDLAKQELPGVLVLFTSRDPDVVKPICRRIDLDALRREHNDAMLAVLSGCRDAALIERLKHAVPLLGSGNPLIATQIVRHLEQQGCLRRDTVGTSNLDEPSLARYAPPDSVGEVVERAIQRVPISAVKVLAVGALLGRQFRLSDVGGLGMFAPAEVAEAVLSAENEALCSTEDDVCTLAHDAIRERLVLVLQGQRLEEIHRRIAERLRHRCSPPGPLAYHLEHAGDVDAATEAYLAAGTEAQRFHDPKTAGRQFSKALELGGEMDPGRRRGTLLRRAAFELTRATAAAGNTDELLGDVSTTAGLVGYGKSRDDYILSSAFARIHYTRGDFRQAAEYSERCLREIGDAKSLNRYRVLPVNVLGRALCASGKFGPAADALGQGCTLARSDGDHLELSHSLGMLGLSIGYTGEFGRARDHVEWGADLAHRAGSPVRKLGALFYAAVAGEYSYNWDLGIARSGEALRFAEEHGIDGLYLYLSMIFAGRHQFHAGELSRAEVLLRQAVRRSEELGIVMGVGWAHAFLGDVHFVRGHHDQALEQYKLGLTAANRGAKDEYAAPLNLIGRAHVFAEQRATPARIQADAEEAIARLRAVRNVSAEAHAHQRLVDVWSAVDAAVEADAARRTAEATFATLGLPVADWWPHPPGNDASETTGSYKGFWRTTQEATPARGKETTWQQVTESLNAARTRHYPPMFAAPDEVQ